MGREGGMVLTEWQQGQKRGNSTCLLRMSSSSV